MKTNQLILVMLAAFFMMAFASSFTQEPWAIPAKYENMKNPVKPDAESLKIGKRLYNKHCKSCHGSEGLGDGTKAAQLDTPCGDFSSKDFQAQSDGAIFYQSYIGRDEMPSFEKKLPDEEDVWHIINYMREF